MRKIFTRLMLFVACALVPLGAAAQMTLPWSENFDSYTTTGGATMPTGWTRVVALNPTSSSATYPNLTTAASHGTVLNIMGQAGPNDGTGTIMIATPLIPAPLNSLELSFQVYKNGLKVYLTSSLDDPASFTLIGTYSPGWVWTTVEIRTDTIVGLPATNGYLVFGGNYGNSGYSTAYVDNLTVTALNNCERPLEVTAERVGVTTAVLTWTEVADAEGYTVYYNTVDDITTAESEDADIAGITLENLEPGTHYYVWVVTQCGEESLSDPRTTEFTTQLSCYTLTNLRQVTVNHEAAAFQWDYDVRGNDADGVIAILHDLSDPGAMDVEEQASGSNYHFFTNLDYTHQYTATFRTLCGADTSEALTVPIVFRHCGESALAQDTVSWSNDHPIVTFYKYTYSQMMYPAYVLANQDTIRGIALRRHVRPQSVATTRKLSIWLGHSTATVSNNPVPTTGMTQVANEVQYLLPNQEWDTLMFTTPFAYDGTSNVVVTIIDNTGSSTSMGANPYWLWHDTEWQMHYKSNDNNPYDGATPPSVSHKTHLPDMRFVGQCNLEELCEAPVLAVTAVDSSSVELAWTAGSGAPWTLQYRPLGSGAWTTDSDVAFMPYTLDSLQPDTRYEVRIGVECDGQMRYSTPIPFLTDCAFQHIPFHFTQSQMVVASQEGFTSCWSFSQYIFRGRLSDSHRGYLRNAGNGEWIILPAMAEPLQGVRLRTWVGSSDHGYFKVGVASQSDCSDVEWIDTVEVTPNNPNTSHEEFVSYLDTYEGEGTRVVVSPIVNNNYHYMYFFDFHLEPIEGCRPVVRLALDSADAQSLSFHWTAVGSATQWAVYVDGVQRGTASGTPSFTVTGLNAYTNYEVSVRALCGQGDTSDAVSAVFLTGCANETCAFTVSGHSAAGDGWHGGFLEASTGNRVIGTVEMRRGSDVSQTFFLCGGMPLSFRWYSGNDDNLCSFVISDEAGNTLYQTADASTIDSVFFTMDSLCGAQGGDPHDTTGIGMVDASQVRLYPNPASSTVTLTGVEPGAQVFLMDLSGRTIAHHSSLITHRSSLITHHSSLITDHSITIDVSGLTSGAYFVRIVGAHTTAVRKLIVR